MTVVKPIKYFKVIENSTIFGFVVPDDLWLLCIGLWLQMISGYYGYGFGVTDYLWLLWLRVCCYRWSLVTMTRLLGPRVRRQVTPRSLSSLKCPRVRSCSWQTCPLVGSHLVSTKEPECPLVGPRLVSTKDPEWHLRFCNILYLFFRSGLLWKLLRWLHKVIDRWIFLYDWSLF